MTNSNPFDRPGLGQGSAANPLMQSLDMMSKAWQQFAQVQNAGSSVFGLPTAMNPDELDKRIQELKSIESWLTMNLSMLSGTIQGLEIQRASIHTMKSFVDSLQTQHQERSLDDILGLKNTPAAPKNTKADSDTGNGPAKTDAPVTTEAVSDAAQAWWDMLQGQFSQLADVANQATQALHKEPSPVKTPPGPEPDEPADPQEPVKPAARKRATTGSNRPTAKRRSAGRSAA